MGIKYSSTGILDVELANEETAEQTGFSVDVMSSLVWDDATLTLTIAPLVTEFWFRHNGKKYTKYAAETATITNVTGMNWIYYDDGVLTISLNPSSIEKLVIIRDKALVAAVYWNAAKGAGLCFDERHGEKMDGETHLALHQMLGAWYLTGLGLTNLVSDGSGALEASIELGVEAGSFRDEDITHSTGSLSTTDDKLVLYLDGTDYNWTSNKYGLINAVAGDNLVAFNDAGSQTEVTSGDYVVQHIAVWNEISKDPFFIQGQFQYTTKPLGEEGILTEVNALLGYQDLFPEMKIIGSRLIKTKTAYSNGAKARGVAIADGSDYLDFRINTASKSRPAIAATYIDDTVRTVSFAIGTDASYISVALIPKDVRVIRTRLIIGTPYSAGTTISIGRVGAVDALVTTAENNPLVANEYDLDKYVLWHTSNVAVLATINGTPVAGAATIVVEYTKPLL